MDFVVGTFIPPSDEQRSKGFVGYNSSVMLSNLWNAYTINEETGHQGYSYKTFSDTVIDAIPFLA